jgi:hypothetical protein
VWTVVIEYIPPSVPFHLLTRSVDFGLGFLAEATAGHLRESYYAGSLAGLLIF